MKQEVIGPFVSVSFDDGKTWWGRKTTITVVDDWKTFVLGDEELKINCGFARIDHNEYCRIK